MTKEDAVTALYITSIERHTGKDLLTMGLMNRMMKDGLKVGYFKPVGHFPTKVGNMVVDNRALLIHRYFGLEDPVELICPVVVTQDLVMQNYKETVTGLREKVTEAFEKVSGQKDLVIVSCDNNFSDGSSFNLSSRRLINLLNARGLFVERYECDFCVDLLIELKEIISEPMIGVVFNKVKPVHFEEIEEFIAPFLMSKGINVFGSLLTDPLLESIEARELAEHLGADVVCGRDQLDALLETFLVGGMGVDKFVGYLLRRKGAGVIVGGDRSDIQMAAIENKARCLILSGGMYPNDIIIGRAEENGVPILVARDDTYTVAKNVEGMVGTFSLADPRKIDHGLDLVDQGFDFLHLYRQVGLDVG
jgi:BioD-like phosphotransacetylase family protein